MPDVLFKGLFDNSATSVISITDFLLCLGVALLAGLIMAGILALGTPSRAAAAKR